MPWACKYINKETLAQVFSCEFCEIFKNTFFTGHLRATACKFLWSSDTAWLHTVPAINERVKTHSSLTKISIFSTVHRFTPTVAKKQITNKQSWFCIYCNTKWLMPKTKLQFCNNQSIARLTIFKIWFKLDSVRGECKFVSYLSKNHSFQYITFHHKEYSLQSLQF